MPLEEKITKKLEEKALSPQKTKESGPLYEQKEQHEIPHPSWEKEKQTETEQTEASSPAAKPSSFSLNKDPDYQKIEEILASGLEDLYANLPAAKKKEFKEKGEETAGKIYFLLQKTKVKVKKIIKLIKNWLKIIPGVNKFFLEQEAKIKADKIMELKEKK